jgi:hypothetical protein
MQMLCKRFWKLEDLDMAAIAGDIFFEELARHADQAKCKALRLSRPVKPPTVGSLCVSLGSKLEKLDLGRMSRMSDEQLQSICKSCPMLKALNFARSLLTDATMEVIGRNGEVLRILNVEQCTTISQAGLLAVTNGCKQLQVLMFTQQFTEILIQSLAQLDKLELLSLGGLVGEDGAVALRNMKRLRYLALSASNVNDELMGKLKSEKPHIRVLIQRDGEKMVQRFWKKI